MQYCVSRHKVIEYCAKYTTKSEPRSKPLKLVYKNIVKQLSDQDKPLKAVQKLLINSVGERDYSAQETCHLLLQLPLYMASRDFVILSLDGTRIVQERLEDSPATALSIVDHYRDRPATPEFEHITLLEFAQKYTMPHGEVNDPSIRSKVVVIVKPQYTPDPNSSHYEDYCRQKLMLYKTFRSETDLLGEHQNFSQAYASYLRTETIPPSLEDDIHIIQQVQDNDIDDNQQETGTIEGQVSSTTRRAEEWMLICQQLQQMDHEPETLSNNVDWCEAARAYPNLEEMPKFITRHKETTIIQHHNLSANPQLLQGKQLQAYQIVQQHFINESNEPLRMIISGTAGTGKSFLINCLKGILQNTVRVAAPTGVAAFNRLMPRDALLRHARACR